MPTRCSSSPRARGRGTSPSTPRRTSRAPASTGRGAIQNVLVHALYLCNLAAPDDPFTKDFATLRATIDTACAIDADGVVVHVGSHLGTGFDAGLDRGVRRSAGARALLRRDLAAARELRRAGGTIGRSLDELAALVDALGGHPRLGICLDSCHLYVSGIDVGDPEAVAEVLADLDAASASTGCARST